MCRVVTRHLAPASWAPLFRGCSWSLAGSELRRPSVSLSGRLKLNLKNLSFALRQSIVLLTSKYLLILYSFISTRYFVLRCCFEFLSRFGLWRVRRFGVSLHCLRLVCLCDCAVCKYVPCTARLALASGLRYALGRSSERCRQRHASVTAHARSPTTLHAVWDGFVGHAGRACVSSVCLMCLRASAAWCAA